MIKTKRLKPVKPVSAIGVAAIGVALMVSPTFASDMVSPTFSDLSRTSITGEQNQMVERCLGNESSSRAVRACTDFIRQSVPDDELRASLHMRRGLHQLALGRYEKAGEDFNRAAELDDSQGYASLGGGFAAIMQDDWKSARENFEDCSSRPALAPLAKYGMGLTYQMTGDTDEARGAYEQALVLRPEWDIVIEQLDTL